MGARLERNQTGALHQKEWVFQYGDNPLEDSARQTGDMAPVLHCLYLADLGNIQQLGALLLAEALILRNEILHHDEEGVEALVTQFLGELWLGVHPLVLPPVGQGRVAVEVEILHAYHPLQEIDGPVLHIGEILLVVLPKLLKEEIRLLFSEKSVLENRLCLLQIVGKIEEGIEKGWIHGAS